MPKAEVGSTKYLSNQLKSKGLQRLRWWCEACHKQCRDENGYKCHTMSESHVRQMQAIGMNANRVISDFSNDFQRNFLTQLRTAHGTKQVHINKFYQEIIAEKEHVHMNSTRWNSLTEFAKHLGREGLVRVEETDKGVHISWIDNSPEALRRAEAIRKKERQDKGDEEREQKLIKEQIARAQQVAETRTAAEDDEPRGGLQRTDGEKIKLSLGGLGAKSILSKQDISTDAEAARNGDNISNGHEDKSNSTPVMNGAPTPTSEKVSMKINVASKRKNVFATSSKKNALGGTKPVIKEASQRPMSAAERIMKEELERKRLRELKFPSGLNVKRPKLS